MYIYIYVCVCVCVCVFKNLRQTIVEQSEVEIITLMEVKTQEHVLKTFSGGTIDSDDEKSPKHM